MSKAGKRLVGAAKEALAIARGEKAPARTHIPSEINVKDIRLKTGLSQDDFAYQYGFTLEQVRNWEQSRSRPIGGVRAYLMIIDRDPEEVINLLRAAQRRQAA